MLGPFATVSHRTPWFYIAIQQVSLLSRRHCCTPPAPRCPRRRRQQQRPRVTEGTAMAPWNGPNDVECDILFLLWTMRSVSWCRTLYTTSCYDLTTPSSTKTQHFSSTSVSSEFINTSSLHISLYTATCCRKVRGGAALWTTSQTSISWTSPMCRPRSMGNRWNSSSTEPIYCVSA